MTNTRKPLGNKLRFDIFKRDLFTCQYCGKNPPSVVLEIDHIIPVSKGGSNEIDNLLTSCFECNRGKTNTSLNTLPSTTAEKLALIQEKEDQYKAYQKTLAVVERRIKKEIEKVNDVYKSHFPKYQLSESFKTGSVRKFIIELGLNEVLVAMDRACSKIYSSNGATKYFCGICWSKIKER